MKFSRRRVAGSHRLALIVASLAAGATVFCMLGLSTAPEPPAADAKPRSSTVVITDTPEAAFGSPQVYVLLRKGKEVVMGEPAGTVFDTAEPGTRVNSFRALLDTGACMHMVSKRTAQRFGLSLRNDVGFEMYGINGPLTLIASNPYDLAIAGSSGTPLTESPGRFYLVHRETTLSIATNDPVLSISQISDMNLVGMPAIRKRIIELDPAPMRRPSALYGAGPAVRILEEDEKVPDEWDVQVQLEYVDYSEAYEPNIPSPHPSHAGCPVLNDVVSERLQSTCTSQWLLDTGAVPSVISYRHAKALGLYYEDGRPVRPPDFTLRLRGAEGSVQPADGYILDRLTVPAKGGKNLEFRNVRVVVRDIGATEVNGRIVVLDGIFGMNLLLPGISGMSSLGEEGQEARDAPNLKISRGSFDRIWIDGPRGVLSLRLRKK